MQTQSCVPCIVSNAGDARCTVWNARGCTELLCADLRPAGCPLLWKYYACVTVHGENWGVGGRAGTRYFWAGARHILPAQPWPLLSLAFSCLVYLGAAVGLGMQTGASGNLQPLRVQPTQALNTGLHGWMISALNNRTALSQHLITRTKQCAIIDIAEWLILLEDLIQAPMKLVERLPLISIDFMSGCSCAVVCFAVNCNILFPNFFIQKKISIF